jgi:ABC-type transport system involved in cytochrome bd biosynthesis fused ATPase/permease subunit
LKAGIGFKIGDFVSLVGRGLGCFIYAMYAAWKFSIVFLGIVPFMILFLILLIVFNKKFTVREFKA